MATKVMEVLVCDLCRSDRPAIARVEIDVCSKHGTMLDERLADHGFTCDQCGRTFGSERSLMGHINRSKSHTKKVA